MCTYLSAFLLVGLVTNSWFGRYWADPLAGLLIAAFAAKRSASRQPGSVNCVWTAASDLRSGGRDWAISEEALKEYQAAPPLPLGRPKEKRGIHRTYLAPLRLVS